MSTLIPNTAGYNNQPVFNYTFTNSLTGPSVPLAAYLNTTDGNTYLSCSSPASASASASASTTTFTPIMSWTFALTKPNTYRICTAQLQRDTIICLDLLTSSFFFFLITTIVCFSSFIFLSSRRHFKPKSNPTTNHSSPQRPKSNTIPPPRIPHPVPIMDPDALVSKRRLAPLDERAYGRDCIPGYPETMGRGRCS